MATSSRPMRLIPVLLSVLLLGACGSVPESMQVRAGVDPRHQDDDVRFRTTYYFRVFDVCRDRNGKALSVTPQGDSLYRFRMTGKAKGGLASHVHFESGILHKTEIDPFGSSIIFDDKLGRHRFVSRKETDDAARREERHGEITRLRKLLKDLLKEGNSIEDDGEAVGAYRKLIGTVVTGIQNQIEGLKPPSEDNGNIASQDANPKCREGGELQRGFQLMGPEGVATFSQDDRLIMAMSSSGKPLINALKMVAGRMLKEHVSKDELMLPLVRENLAALRAERILDDLGNDPNVPIDQLIEQVIDSFDQEAP